MGTNIDLTGHTRIQVVVLDINFFDDYLDTKKS